MTNKNLYLWRDYLLSKKVLRQVLSEQEYKEYFNPKICRLCKEKKRND